MFRPRSGKLCTSSISTIRLALEERDRAVPWRVVRQIQRGVPVVTKIVVEVDTKGLQIRLALELFDKIAGFLARAIVGDHDLEIVVGLVVETPQHFLQPFGGVVGGKDNADFHRITSDILEPCPQSNDLPGTAQTRTVQYCFSLTH